MKWWLIVLHFPFSRDEVDNVIQSLVDAILAQPLKSNLVEKPHLEEAVKLLNAKVGSFQHLSVFLDFACFCTGLHLLHTIISNCDLRSRRLTAVRTWAIPSFYTSLVPSTFLDSSTSQNGKYGCAVAYSPQKWLPSLYSSSRQILNFPLKMTFDPQFCAQEKDCDRRSVRSQQKERLWGWGRQDRRFHLQVGLTLF